RRWLRRTRCSSPLSAPPRTAALPVPRRRPPWPGRGDYGPSTHGCSGQGSCRPAWPRSWRLAALASPPCPQRLAQPSRPGFSSPQSGTQLRRGSKRPRTAATSGDLPCPAATPALAPGPRTPATRPPSLLPLWWQTLLLRYLDELFADVLPPQHAEEGARGV